MHDDTMPMLFSKVKLSQQDNIIYGRWYIYNDGFNNFIDTGVTVRMSS